MWSGAPTLAEYQRARASDRAAGVMFGAHRGAALDDGRAAGVAAVVTYSESTPPPTWNGEPASFTGDQWGGAFWMLGTDLFVSSGARLLADLRTELAASGGGTGGAEHSALARVPRDQWKTTVLTFLHARARAALVSAGVSTAWVDGLSLPDAVVPRDWLRLAIWYTYLRARTPRIDGVRMARDLLVPALDASLGSASAATGVFRGFRLTTANREGFESDSAVFVGPFPGQVQQGPEIDVGGRRGDGGNGGGGNDGGEAGAFAVGALLLLLAGEDK